MRIFVCVVCLLIFATMTACKGDDQLIVETKATAIVRKDSVASGTFNVLGDITTLTIN